MSSYHSSLGVPLSMVAGLCHFVFSPRNNTTRKNEKTPREKTKRQNNAMRKDEITPCKMTKRRNNATRKHEIKIRVGISTFRVAGFVISSFRVALFRRKRDTGTEIKQLKSQEDRSFSTDGHKAILNKLNSKSKTNGKRANFDN